jgi:hypothetical protein
MAGEPLAVPRIGGEPLQEFVLLRRREPAIATRDPLRGDIVDGGAVIRTAPIAGRGHDGYFSQ